MINLKTGFQSRNFVWTICYNDAGFWVLIVPMRNWNISMRMTLSPTAYSFDRTYEELKPIFGRTKSNKYPVLIVPMRNWNQKTRGRGTRGIGVLIVPMRNWNGVSSYVYPVSSIIRFWSYLWGIETRPRISNHQAVPKFWSYLWGIETTIALYTFMCAIPPCFDRTYEELKPSQCGHSQVNS